MPLTQDKEIKNAPVAKRDTELDKATEPPTINSQDIPNGTKECYWESGDQGVRSQKAGEVGEVGEDS